MAFWSSETIKQRLGGEMVVDPYHEGRVMFGAYEMALGPEAFVTSDSKGKKQKISEGEQLIIPPGQFGLLLTEEVLNIPTNVIGFISIKAGIKFRGLVNVSGFHVDPGFRGRLKFSVYNAGSQNIVLNRGQQVFLIWFSDLDHETGNSYNGQHLNQNEITSEDVMRIQGRIASPAALDQRVRKIENTLAIIKAIVVGVLVFLIGRFVFPVVQEFVGSPEETPKPSVKESRPVGVSPGLRENQSPEASKVEKPGSEKIKKKAIE